MPMLRTITTGLLGRSAARRIGRFIPNPVVRFVAVAAATQLVPLLLDRAEAQWKVRSSARARRKALRAGEAQLPASTA